MHLDPARRTGGDVSHTLEDMRISEAGIELFFMFAYLAVFVAWSPCVPDGYDPNNPSK